LFREGLKSLLTRNNLRVVAEVEAFAEASGPQGMAKPDVVVAVSPEFNGIDGPAWRERFEQSWPSCFVVVVAASSDDNVLIEALRAGADGCLFTDMSGETMAQAIKLVAMGENVFPTRVGKAFTHSIVRVERSKLTPRERDILRGLLAGHSNKMIANALGTTDMTVKAQLRHLLRKLGVANRTQAALWAREQGLDREFHL